MGPSIAAFAERLFEGPLPWVKLRQGQKLLSLGERYTPARLYTAARRSRWGAQRQQFAERWRMARRGEAAE